MTVSTLKLNSVLLLTSLVLAIAISAVLPVAAPGVGEDIWYAVGVSTHDLVAGMEPTLVISALAREGTELPVEAAIAIPKGSQVSWAGEILGGDTANDPELAVAIDEGPEYDVVRFTLTQSLRAQIEATVPEGWLVTSDTGTRIDMKWTSAGLVDRARMAIVVPISGHVENGIPEPVVDLGPSEVVYSVETSPVASGQTLTLGGDLVPGPAPELEAMMGQTGADSDSEAGTEVAEIQPIQASEDPPSDEGNTGLLIVVALLAAVVVGLIFAVVRSRSSEDGVGEAPDDSVDSDEE